MSKTATILSVMKPIADILMNNYTPYFIPDFQRDFVWGEKEEFRDIRRIESSFAAVFDFSFLIVAQESVGLGFSGFIP